LHNLVIATKQNLKVSGIYKGFSDPQQGSWPDQPFKVIACSTEEGWIDYLVDFHGEKVRSWLEVLVKTNGPWLYYEIHAD